MFWLQATGGRAALRACMGAGHIGLRSRSVELAIEGT